MNIKNPDEYISKIEADFVARKKIKKEEIKEKSAKEKKVEKLADKISDMDKKGHEKKEKDKILTKKER